MSDTFGSDAAKTALLSQLEVALTTANDVVAQKVASENSRKGENGTSPFAYRNKVEYEVFNGDTETIAAVRKYRDTMEVVRAKIASLTETVNAALVAGGYIHSEAASFDKESAKAEYTQAQKFYTALMSAALAGGVLSLEEIHALGKLSNWAGTGTTDAVTKRPRFSSIVVVFPDDSTGFPEESTSTSLATYLNQRYSGDKSWKRVTPAELNANLPVNFNDGPSSYEFRGLLVKTTPVPPRQ